MAQQVVSCVDQRTVESALIVCLDGAYSTAWRMSTASYGIVSTQPMDADGLIRGKYRHMHHASTHAVVS